MTGYTYQKGSRVISDSRALFQWLIGHPDDRPEPL